jgi:hypothetical protein
MLQLDRKYRRAYCSPGNLAYRVNTLFLFDVETHCKRTTSLQKGFNSLTAPF